MFFGVKQVGARDRREGGSSFSTIDCECCYVILTMDTYGNLLFFSLYLCAMLLFRKRRKFVSIETTLKNIKSHGTF